MNITIRSAFGAIALAAMLAAPTATADIDPTPPDKEAPDTGGTRGGAAEGAGEEIDPAKAVGDIEELMRDIEQALAESDADLWTQRQQKKVSDALELGGKSVDQLKKLIKHLEEQAGKGGGGGGQGQKGGQKPQGGQGKAPKPQGSRSNDTGGRKLNPQSGQKPQGADRPKPGETPEQASRRMEIERELQIRRAASIRRTASGNDSWGNLPQKQAREVMDANARPKPLKYRSKLEEYYKRLAEGDR